MLCKKPYSFGVMAFGCGQCMPCRINRSRAWVGRILLESYQYPASAFVTLTYNDEEVPKDGCLSKRALQLFFKLLRQEIAPRKIRYYAVGEYGSLYGRPHYHAIVFGLFPHEGLVVAKSWRRVADYDKFGDPIWISQGFSYMGDVTSGSVSYVAGYLTKQKYKFRRDEPRPDGRTHEFVLMSKGIAKGVVDNYVKAYSSKSGKAALFRDGWIAESFRTEGKLYPVGRYLKGKILDKMGISAQDREAHFQASMLKVWDSEDRSIHMTQRLIDKRAAKVVYQSGKINILSDKRRNNEKN